jgi:hypothetical protein
VRAVFEAAARGVADAQVESIVRGPRSIPLLILDIDNTIADTWPSYASSWPSETARLAGLLPIPEVREAVYERAVDTGKRVMFLSHRQLGHRRVTLRWLRLNGFAMERHSVVLVPAAADKVALVRRLAKVTTVEYWDDLSYGHERGGPFFYTALIERIRATSVDYHGWEDICALRGIPSTRGGADAPAVANEAAAAETGGNETGGNETGEKGRVK